ncbi:MAG: DUF3644 domain-containing protein [Pseudomonadota bacterium]
MATKRIGKNLRPYLDKARDSALLAIEVYNKPAVSFRSAGYIALMAIAWTSLLHAIFLRRNINPYYKHPNGHYKKIDGDYWHWDISECVKQFWKDDAHSPVRKNVEFFIPLRNKIEHRHIPELDAVIFGECQALLLNFDALMGAEFGPKHQLRESLSFSLQLFPSGESFAAAVKANKSLKDVKKFIDDYRSAITPEVMGSGQFAFKAFLIQVANHQSEEALPVQFVHYDSLTPDQKAEVEKFAALVKFKNAGALNAGLLKPGEVVKAVQAGLGNIKLERNGKQTDKFNADTHTRCWKHYKARPKTGAKKPEQTKAEYCSYDKAHKDYLYTQAWVNFLIEKMADENEYAQLYEKL